MKTDIQYIEQALDYARTHAVGTEGQVGAVVVHDNAIISSGASNDEQGVHAEQSVLDGINAVGATLYVTIQPSLYRSDDSISSDIQTVIDAGITRVVVGSINKKYPLQESKDFFTEHNIELVFIDNESVSQQCLDLFVSTGADQAPRILSLVGVTLMVSTLMNSMV